MLCVVCRYVLCALCLSIMCVHFSVSCVATPRPRHRRPALHMSHTYTYVRCHGHTAACRPYSGYIAARRVRASLRAAQRAAPPPQKLFELVACVVGCRLFIGRDQKGRGARRCYRSRMAACLCYVFYFLARLRNATCYYIYKYIILYIYTTCARDNKPAAVCFHIYYRHSDQLYSFCVCVCVCD